VLPRGDEGDGETSANIARSRSETSPTHVHLALRPTPSRSTIPAWSSLRTSPHETGEAQQELIRVTSGKPSDSSGK